jgi:hypothetical protein
MCDAANITFAPIMCTKLKNYGGRVLLVASQILLGSLLLVNHFVY